MSLKKNSVLIKDQTNYTIDEDGNVFNKYGKELKHDITHDGYHRVTLYKNGKSKHYPIHRLVADAYIPNPENKPTVNHIDGNKNNNSVYNLEWSTRSENTQHAYDNGLNRCHFTNEDRSRGIYNAALKSRKSVRMIETDKTYPSATECARDNNLDVGNVVACCNKKRKSHHGYHFEWV